MLKYLRIAVTALSLTACVLLIALWVRSYYFRDAVAGPISASRSMQFSSDRGRTSAQLYLNRSGMSWHWKVKSRRWKLKSIAIDQVEAEERALADTFGRPIRRFHFDFYTQKYGFYVRVPSWLLVLISAVFGGAIFGLGRLNRFTFSLRTLLIATTLVALAAIVYAAR